MHTPAFWIGAFGWLTIDYWLKRRGAFERINRINRRTIRLGQKTFNEKPDLLNPYCPLFTRNPRVKSYKVRLE